MAPDRRVHGSDTARRVRARAPRGTVRRRSPTVAFPRDIVTTKLNTPQPRPNLVRRLRLLARLDAGLTHGVTLVCAPAGFGKTMLISDWVHHLVATAPIRTASWLSLDEGDDDPARFMRYVAVALHRLTPRASETIRAALQSPSPPSPRALMGILINDLARLPTESVLVLDDYHLLRDRSIHDAVTFLLDHLPPRFHLLIATREDPPLPLARFRAGNAIAELRQADLRFTVDEATAFLRDVMGLTLSAADVQVLQTRTEGWIAGLQLAALSMQDRVDTAGFIAAFHGSNRYVLDYLVEGVISRQSELVQDFLLRTSIVDRLCGPLCDAVLETPKVVGEGAGVLAQDMLEHLERANLFVEPLDAERRWYRYHALFGELLRLRLRQTRPELVADLHRRASAWHEQAGLPADAIRHALAGSDVDHAARLIERHALPLMYRGQSRLVLGWLDALPAGITHDHPYLALFHAVALAVTQDLDRAERYLQDIEHDLLPTLTSTQRRVFRGWVIGVRSFITLYVGDTERGVALARQALPLLPATEVIRPPMLGVSAAEFLVSGDVGPATEHEVAALALPGKDLNNLYLTLRNIALLGRLHIMQGRLRQAAATYARAAGLVPGQSRVQDTIGGLTYRFGPGALLLERGELDAAERMLAQGRDALTDADLVLPADVLLGHAALAGVRQARGDGPGALAVMAEFTEVARRRNFVPSLLAQAAAVVARLRLRQGDLADAAWWAEGSGLQVGDEVRYPREAEYLTLVRVRIAQGHAAETMALLDRILKAAEAGGRGRSAIEILIVRALARQAQGHTAAALADLTRALALAEPEGYVRIFADEGRPIEVLLQRVAARRVVSRYAAKLLAAIRATTLEAPQRNGGSPGEAPLLAEPLTAREREVLQLLAADASNAEIARKLVLTVGTVKTHVHNIFGKLGIRSRAQVTAKASDLHLL